MRGSGLHLLERFLKVVHSSSATWASDIFRLIETPSGSLHQLIDEVGTDSGFLNRNLVARFILICASEFKFVQSLIQQSLTEITRDI